MRAKKERTINYAKVGQLIRNRRLEMGLTQDKLASRCHCSPTHISRMEGGKAGGLEMLYTICLQMGLSMDAILGIHPGQDKRISELNDLFICQIPADQELILKCLRDIVSLMPQYRKSLSEFSYTGLPSFAPAWGSSSSALIAAETPTNQETPAQPEN